MLGKRLPSVPTTELTKPPDVVSTMSSTTAGVGLTGRSEVAGSARHQAAATRSESVES
eukprot:COSAG06_NODE_47210_length_341_cov_0.260331_1_plen_57_part_01